MSQAERLPQNYQEIDLEYLDADDLLQIEQYAGILELEECYDFLFVDSDDIPESEHDIAVKVHKRGRKKAIGSALGHLIGRMKDRNGTQACIEYLRQFAGTFHIETTPEASASSHGFNSNVIMPDDKKEPGS